MAIPAAAGAGGGPLASIVHQVTKPHLEAAPPPQGGCTEPSNCDSLHNLSGHPPGEAHPGCRPPSEVNHAQEPVPRHDRPSRGKVLLDGQDLCELGDSALAKLRSRRIGFVFQLHHLLPQCTVLENVLLPTIAANNSKLRKQAQARAAELLERVGLANFVNHRPGELSGGQRQRAAVVRALINKPELVLADEPTGSLDKDNAEDISDLLVELNHSSGLVPVMSDSITFSVVANDTI